jgi:hypothetical protein
MLDLARALVLVFALVRAARNRFTVGVAFGGMAALVLGAVGTVACRMLLRHEVSGDYAFSLVYVGPTTLPLGGREWSPLAVQLGLAAITAVPALVALRSTSNPASGPSLLVFVPNAILAVTASFSAYFMWRQDQILPGYWDNPSLVESADTRSYQHLTLRPGSEERALAGATTGKPVKLLVRNFTGEPVDLVWIDAAGHRHFRLDWAVGPGLVLAVPSFEGAAFVVTDEDARAMCTFVVGGADAAVDVEGVCR